MYKHTSVGVLGGMLPQEISHFEITSEAILRQFKGQLDPKRRLHMVGKGRRKVCQKLGKVHPPTVYEYLYELKPTSPTNHTSLVKHLCHSTTL